MPLSVTGLKYKETVLNVNNYKKRAELTILAVTDTDFRAYRCNAKSSRGTDSGYIFVHSKSIFLNRLKFSAFYNEFNLCWFFSLAEIDPPLTPQAGYIVKGESIQPINMSFWWNFYNLSHSPWHSITHTKKSFFFLSSDQYNDWYL